MNQLIFEEIKLDFNDHIRMKGQQLKEQCYQKNKVGLDGVRSYAQCLRDAKNQLQVYEKRGKYNLLFMELSARNKETFNLVESVTNFIEKYELDTYKRQEVI